MIQSIWYGLSPEAMESELMNIFWAEAIPSAQHISAKCVVVLHVSLGRNCCYCHMSQGVHYGLVSVIMSSSGHDFSVHVAVLTHTHTHRG